MNKGMLKRIIVSLFIIGSFFGGIFLGRFATLSETTLNIPEGYVDIEQELINDGYLFRTRNFYEKKHHGLSENIIIDYNSNKVLRNDFVIDIKDAYICQQKCFIQPEKMEEIVLKQPYTFALFGTKYAPLIAHAGGGYRTKQASSTYTNAYEAIKQNYELGHRFFELDFQFTSDKKLAALHNWSDPSSILNEHDWLIQKTTPEALQNLTLTKVLDLLLVHRDMFLITDSKAFEISDEEQEEQFNLIYEEIMKRDAELLNRVIPQSYSKKMLDEHPVFHNFPNVILTSYAADMSAAEILETLDEHPNIQMFTTDVLGQYIDDDKLVKGIKERNKKLGIHTINEYKDFTDKRYINADSYYTDFLTPKDWKTWKESPVGKQ